MRFPIYLVSLALAISLSLTGCGPMYINPALMEEIGRSNKKIGVVISDYETTDAYNHRLEAGVQDQITAALAVDLVRIFDVQRFEAKPLRDDDALDILVKDIRIPRNRWGRMIDRDTTYGDLTSMFFKNDINHLVILGGHCSTRDTSFHAGQIALSIAAAATLGAIVGSPNAPDMCRIYVVVVDKSGKVAIHDRWTYTRRANILNGEQRYRMLSDVVAGFADKVHYATVTAR